MAVSEGFQGPLSLWGFRVEALALLSAGEHYDNEPLHQSRTHLTRSCPKGVDPLGVLIHYVSP